jgi:hypothetical protein
MMATPLVSVLMTSFNREKYIKLSIDSLLSSSYSNWELIVLDDCSSDKTFKIAKEYEKLDPRIKAFQNPINLGQFKNRNEIVKYAKGKYLKYLDSDDLIYTHGLEILVENMEQFPDAGYGLCSLPQNIDTMYPFCLSPCESYEWHYLKKRSLFHKAPLSSIIKKDAFHSINGFPHEAVSGDFAMWNHLSQSFNVVLIQQGIVWYRKHEEQEMQKACSAPRASRRPG